MNKYAIFLTEMDDFAKDYIVKYKNMEFDNMLEAMIFLGYEAENIDDNEFAYKLEIKQIK